MIKTHWRLNNRRVRITLQGKVYRLMIYWNNKLGLIHPIKLGEINKALEVAKQIEEKGLINTTVWNKIWFPKQYSLWHKSFVFCD